MDKLESRLARWYVYLGLGWLTLEALLDYFDLLSEVLSSLSAPSEQFGILAVVISLLGFSALVVTFWLQEQQSVIEHRQNRIRDYRKMIFSSPGIVFELARLMRDEESDITVLRQRRSTFIKFDRWAFGIMVTTTLLVAISSGLGESRIFIGHFVIGSLVSSGLVLVFHILYRRGDV